MKTPSAHYWNNRVICAVFAVVLLVIVVRSTLADGTTAPSPSSPLQSAAEQIALGELDKATQILEEIVQASDQSPHVRGLARIGLARIARAKNDWETAESIWKSISSDDSLLTTHHAIARERLLAVQRLKKGKPAYDVQSHRIDLPVIAKPIYEVHVATAGDDSTGDGTADRPFRSLQKARDAIRNWKLTADLPASNGSIQVIVHDGQYSVSDSFALTLEDSGSADCPVVYRAANISRAVFDGGLRIGNWKPVEDEKTKKRLAGDACDQIYSANLSDQGLTDFGDATALRKAPELFCNGVPQTLARWPNTGFVKTGDLLGSETFKVWSSIDGCRDGKFKFVEDRPLQWQNEPDIRLYGYWFWDWFEQFQTVKSIDPKNHSFILSPPYSNYGYRKDQRYFAVNVLCELDRPGEWYLDRQNGIVFWFPPKDTDIANADVTLSVFNGPFVQTQGAKHVILLGLTFQNGRGQGIHIRGGSDNLVAGCIIRRLGGDAVVIDGGQRNGLFGCKLHSLGCGGARVNGGDREKLARGEHFVENCSVNDISRLKRTYTPAVHLDGCGNRVAHNLFQSIPSSAMRIEGNDQLIELNTIRNVVQESDDQGGLDMFGNPLYRGVVIRWNEWSDIVGGTHCGAAGIRLDDMISGVLVRGNVFRNCGAELFGGVQIHGGKENLVDGNLFLDCYAGVSFSRWGEKRWLETTSRFEKQANKPPYSERYPALKQLRTGVDISFISRNIFSNCKSTFLRDGGVPECNLNAVAKDRILPNSVSNSENIQEHPSVDAILFDPIPVDDIGPYAHPWRVRSECQSIDLDSQSNRQIVVDREEGQYLGHPTTCLLEDGKTMLCVYPKGHGRGAIIYKRSNDGGLTWSDRLPTPASWATSKEVPTLHRVIGPDGKKRIVMWSGLYPARLAVTENDGESWSELKPVGNWGGIVVMGFVEALNTGPGHYLAMFHDDGRFFAKDGKRTNLFRLYKTFSTDGGLTWSFPEVVFESSEVHLCEPGCIRSPDGKRMAVLLRENSRTNNSHIIFSDDEGKSFSNPREVPLSLTGDRHTGKYGPDGRLFISFRCIAPKQRVKEREFEGDWVAWVGTWEDIVDSGDGQYLVRLKDNTKGYDTLLSASPT